MISNDFLETHGAQIQKEHIETHRMVMTPSKMMQIWTRMEDITDIKNHKYSLVPGRYTGCMPYKNQVIPKNSQQFYSEIISKRFSRIKNIQNTLLSSMEQFSK